MAVIPLFPLRTVLFPKGKLPLQIFEPRYVDLVTSSLKKDSGFGVVLIERGHEVVRANQPVPPEIHSIATYAKITDWNTLDNGCLGITVSGEQKIRIGETSTEPNHLLVADVTFMEQDPALFPEEHEELLDILNQLMEHPLAKRLDLSPQSQSAEFVSCLLSQFLPISEDEKYRLLCLHSALERLEELQSLIHSMGG